MSMTNPPPPAVGDVFEGPSIGHGHPRLDTRKGRYYVRAVVDAEEHPEYGWLYEVVFCFWTRHKGWRYTLVDSFSFGFEMYRKISKSRRPARPPSVRSPQFVATIDKA
jgi:hypothetical protein